MGWISLVILCIKVLKSGCWKVSGLYEIFCILYSRKCGICTKCKISREKFISQQSCNIILLHTGLHQGNQLGLKKFPDSIKKKKKKRMTLISVLTSAPDSLSKNCDHLPDRPRWNFVFSFWGKRLLSFFFSFSITHLWLFPLVCELKCAKWRKSVFWRCCLFSS